MCYDNIVYEAWYVFYKFFWIMANDQNTDEYKKIAFSMLFILSGYGFLVISDNFVFMILGLPLLLLGTYGYLRALHSLYMWR